MDWLGGAGNFAAFRALATQIVERRLHDGRDSFRNVVGERERGKVQFHPRKHIWPGVEVEKGVMAERSIREFFWWHDPRREFFFFFFFFVFFFVIVENDAGWQITFDHAVL